MTTHKLGSGVSWWQPKDFERKDLNRDNFRVYGFMFPRPKKGDKLIAEFEKSYITFKFVKVDLCQDPDDMFFADVRAVSQQMK